LVNELLTINLAEGAVFNDLLQLREHAYGIGEKQCLETPLDLLLQINLTDRSDLDTTKPFIGRRGITGPISAEFVEEVFLSAAAMNTPSNSASEAA
jgi:hypothetical protein